MRYIKNYLIFESSLNDARNYIITRMSYYESDDFEDETQTFLEVLSSTEKEGFFILGEYRKGSRKYARYLSDTMKNIFGQGPYNINQFNDGRVGRAIENFWNIDPNNRAMYTYTDVYSDTPDQYDSDFLDLGIIELFSVAEYFDDLNPSILNGNFSLLEFIYRAISRDGLSLHDVILEILAEQSFVMGLKNKISLSSKESEGLDLLMEDPKILTKIYPKLPEEIKVKIDSKFGINLDVINRLRDLGDIGFF